MAKYKLEYLWLDGYEPVPNIRGKTQVKEFASFPKLEELPLWAFDGSSTRQAEGKSSDCMLKPVAVYPDTTKKNGVIVMNEVVVLPVKVPGVPLVSMGATSHRLLAAPNVVSPVRVTVLTALFCAAPRLLMAP